MKIIFVLVYSSVYGALAESPGTTISKKSETGTSRIVGGSAAERHEFPYQVSYQQVGFHICGGSILSKRWVVTAAHCIRNQTDSLRVVAGMLYRNESHTDLQISGVERQVVHSKFNRTDHDNDIALVRLSTSLTRTEAVLPIRLPRYKAEPKGRVVLTGWGYLSSNHPVIPITLQKVEMSVMTFKECLDIVGPNVGLTNRAICLRGIDTGICQGDSGGPMAQNGKLLGVASWVLKPCGRSLSGYVKVSRYVRWIKKHMRRRRLN